MGDAHGHTTWSDGDNLLAEMAGAAANKGYSWWACTDHSPRLTIANGLNRERLSAQLEEISAYNAHDAAVRVLSGMEVDILADGELDSEPDILRSLDIVVGSCHYELKMEHQPMTERILGAIESGCINVLGHMSNRKVWRPRGGPRPPSTFDVEAVLTACAQKGVAVEINCQPQRLDPPTQWLEMARDLGCWFMISTDAHAVSELDNISKGCDRAARAGIDASRVINTRDADWVTRWASKLEGEGDPLAPVG